MVNKGSEHSDKKLVLVGGGGHCKSVLDAARKSGEYSEIVITDPFLKQGTLILDCSVAGGDEVLPKLRKQGFSYAFITVGSIKNARLREYLADKTSEFGFVFPVIKDASATVSAYTQIEAGTFIGKNAIINAGSRIGKHCIINTGCIIEHECLIEDFVHISVGAILCGSVYVHKNSFIGAGSTVIQGISIGKNSVVGANSTVIGNVEDGQIVTGIVKASEFHKH